MSTQSMSTKSSSAAAAATTTSDRNKNLLAAKSVLGLDSNVYADANNARSGATDNAPSTTPTINDASIGDSRGVGGGGVDSSTIVSSYTDMSNVTSLSPSPSARARGSSATSQQHQHQLSSASASRSLVSSSRSLRTTNTTASTATSSSSRTRATIHGSVGGGSKHSLIHNLSDTARLEARQRSSDGVSGYNRSHNNSVATLEYVRRTSGGSEGRSLRGNNIDNDRTKTFEYESRTSRGSDGRSRGSNNNSSTFDNVTRTSGGSDGRSRGGATTTSAAQERALQEERTSQSHLRSSTATTTRSLAATTTSSTASVLSTKASITSRGDNTRISMDGSINDISILEEGSEYDSMTAKPFATHMTKESVRHSLLLNTSNTSFSERTASSNRSSNVSGRSNNNNSSSKLSNNPRRDVGASSSELSQNERHHSQSNNDQQHLFQYSTQSVTTASLLSEVSSNNIFVPQRFDEVRSLLMAVTPLQLEGLLREIFENNNANDTHHPRHVLPRGWKGTAKKSKSRKFRKDAYLSELTLDEIKRYTSDKNIHGMEECVTREEAMDLIAFEFEHLVSGIGGQFENGSTTSSSFVDGHDANDSLNQSHQGSFVSDQDTMMHASSSSLATYNNNNNNNSIMENSNTTANITNEVTNLRSTLRACTLPELQFVAERMELNLDVMSGLNKSELILMIENAVPGIMSHSENSVTSDSPSQRMDSSSQRMDEEYSMSQQQQYEEEEGESQVIDEYYHSLPQPEEIYDDYDSDGNYIARQGRQQGFDDSRYRRVQFADTPQRNNQRERGGGNWKNVSSTDDYDVEHGYDDDDDYGDRDEVMPFRDNAKRKRKKGGKKQQRKRASPTTSIFGSIKNIKSFELSSLNKRPWMIFGLVLLIALAVGLSVGLTKKDSSSEEDQELSNPFISDPSDPFFQNELEKAGSTVMPSARPSVRITEVQEGVPPTEDALAALFSSPTALPGINSFAPTTSTSTMAQSGASQSPVVPLVESTTTDSPTTLVVTDILPMTTNSPTASVTDDIASSTTTAPTVAYPLLGPFDESGMRIILYGVSELSDNGGTQWQMLTAAFINQFFNDDDEGDDAVQNIVFDVVASVGIESTDDWISAGRRSRRQLKEGSTIPGVIVTFTMTLSYRSLSSGIDSKTIAEHPFLDEEIRSEYYGWLIDNNAVAYIGEITGISSIFYGEDFPDTEPLLATLAPTQSSVPDLPEVNSPVTEQTPTQFPTTVLDSPAPSAMDVTTLAPSVQANLVTSEPPLLLSEQTPTQFPTTVLDSPAPSAAEVATLEPPSTSDSITLVPSLSITKELTSVETHSPSAATMSAAPTLSTKPSSESSGEAAMADTYSPVGSPRSTAAYVITSDPTTSKTTKALPESCEEFPTTDPICPLLAEFECCQPMCIWDSSNIRCSFADDRTRNEVNWTGKTEIGQTHVVRAVDETRHAPKVIAHREAELLFTPGVDGVRKLGLHDKHSVVAESSTQRLESYGEVYLVNEDDGPPILDASAQRLVDGSKSVFALPNDIPDIGIIIDLKSLRLVEDVSIVLHGDTSMKSARLGFHYDDGRSQEDEESFGFPRVGWEWFDYSSPPLEGYISFPCPRRQARYIMFRFEGGGSSMSHWGFSNIEIGGRLDGLSPDPAQSSHDAKFLPLSRSNDLEATATTTSRSFIPPRSANLRIAVYSSSGNLIGVKKVRDPSKQRQILERQLSSEVHSYSDSIWSVTLPYNWVEEGNVILIGCIDNRRPTDELLVHRLELKNLAQFSEHTVTRTKLAIFGDASQVATLNSNTHEAKRLARNLFSVMPVAQLHWADTDIWHLPYIVVMGKEGPALVNSEEERRSATGEGTEISWSVMKDYLTVRHSLAQTGFGLSVTSESGQNSPYASGTSVFMGWSLSKHSDGDEMEWEDLGYWDTLAAAAWTGWCALKAGDECSNYFVHEMGHAQSMEHFDEGTALKWGIENEYPQDGKHMSHHPWGFDTVERKFRTLVDYQGDGKLDPLNGAGEDPTSEHCFSQYTPYQAQKSQEWAVNTPILLSASASSVPVDGAYKFNRSAHRYLPLKGSLLTDAVGADAMQPDRVGIPVITLIGTIGKENEVCQIYPALRSRLGNTFHFPNPFSPDLPSTFLGAAHYIEVKFVDGTVVRGLIAVEKDLSEKTLKFFSFNLGLDLLPSTVSLYRFTDNAYPEVSSQSATELLHLRPLKLPSGNPMEGVPPLLRVGRGWLGGSPAVVLDRFCVSADDCSSDRYSVEWRADVGNLMYKSSLSPEPQNLLGATVFKVPVVRQLDSTGEYSITILITRSNDSDVGSLPLLTTDLPPDESSDDIDVTHALRVVAPWEMNASLPGGTYHSIPGALRISAEAVGSTSNRHIIDIDISLSLGTITEQPTLSPSKPPAAGPSHSPIQVRWYIDWRLFTCVTDGESTEWAPAYVSKLECCQNHMGYDVNLCLGNE